MGLLEKALKYKRDINKRGKETLIDKIEGPAETEFLDVEEAGAGEEVQNEYQMTESELDNFSDILEDDGNDLSLPDGAAVVETDDSSDGGDDLFELHDDEESPAEILEYQKIQSHKVEEDESIAAGKSGSDTNAADIISCGEDPFGPDDEPVFKEEVRPGDLKEEDRPDLEEPAEKVNKVEDIMENIDGLSGKDSAEFKTKETKDLISKMNSKEIKNIEASGDQHISEGVEVPVKPDKKFQDFMVLYEISKEIVKAENRKELYDVILFSIMGQIGASSSSILIPFHEDYNKWIVADSSGVTIRNKELFFDIDEEIFKKFITGKAIIDIEDYKDILEYRDEYYKFISIDARLLSPLNYNGRIIGAIVLGDKITIGDYSNEERDFISSVCEISSIALKKINSVENLEEENEKQKADLDNIQNVDILLARLIGDTSISRIEEIINSEFDEMGVESFSLFINNEKDDNFFPLIVDRDDSLSFKQAGFVFNYDSSFVEFIRDLQDNVKIADFESLKIIKETFKSMLIKIMSHFWIYPFKIGVNLIGFLIIFRISEREEEIDKKLSRLSRVIFSYILNIQELDMQVNRYVDNIELILKRVDRELKNAKMLKIPLTLVLFSIKNFKRYYNLFGFEESKRLIFEFEEVIKSRLTAPDFAVRLDRNKILIVQPGKNKKYAVPLANTLRNEILQGFKKKEMQLLVTFLTAEYPEDGEDLYNLLDSIEPS